MIFGSSTCTGTECRTQGVSIYACSCWCAPPMYVAFPSFSVRTYPVGLVLGLPLQAQGHFHLVLGSSFGFYPSFLFFVVLLSCFSFLLAFLPAFAEDIVDVSASFPLPFLLLHLLASTCTCRTGASLRVRRSKPRLPLRRRLVAEPRRRMAASAADCGVAMAWTDVDVDVEEQGRVIDYKSASSSSMNRDVGTHGLERGLVRLGRRTHDLLRQRELDVQVVELLRVGALAELGRHDASLDDLHARCTYPVARRHLVVELIHGAVERGVPVLLVRVVIARSRLVADPYAVVLHQRRLLLEDFVARQDLSVRFLHSRELLQKVPELALGPDVIGCEQLHAVDLRFRFLLRGQVASHDLILRSRSCIGQSAARRPSIVGANPRLRPCFPRVGVDLSPPALPPFRSAWHPPGGTSAWLRIRSACDHAACCFDGRACGGGGARAASVFSSFFFSSHTHVLAHTEGEIGRTTGSVGKIDPKQRRVCPVGGTPPPSPSLATETMGWDTQRVSECERERERRNSPSREHRERL